MKRRVYRITYRATGKRKGWHVKGPSILTLRCDNFGPFAAQRSAIIVATGYARFLQRQGELMQVVLHGKDGRIRWERTYGRDPRRTKG